MKIEVKRSILVLLYLCCSITIALFFISMIAQLLGGWLVWNIDEPFPLEIKDVLVALKISLIGVPIGFIFWFFGIK